jgi:hypothetical protein
MTLIGISGAGAGEHVCTVIVSLEEMLRIELLSTVAAGIQQLYFYMMC